MECIKQVVECTYLHSSGRPVVEICASHQQRDGIKDTKTLDFILLLT